MVCVIRLLRVASVALLLSAGIGVRVHAGQSANPASDGPSFVHEGDVPAPVDAVWKVWTAATIKMLQQSVAK